MSQKLAHQISRDHTHVELSKRVSKQSKTIHIPLNTASARKMSKKFR
jgi:hypothetical protein